MKENSNGKTGVVYVRSTGTNQHGQAVLTYVRWVMVRKRDERRRRQFRSFLILVNSVDPAIWRVNLPKLESDAYDFAAAGSPDRHGDYAVGERIDHVDAMTLEEAEHQIATRLYQNTAKVHFNNHEQSQGRFGARLIYGGVVISLARALSFNGLANAFHIAAINGGRHVAPAFAGDTVYCWSEVIGSSGIPNRPDIGALRVRTVATKDLSCRDYPYRVDDQSYADGVILDLDYWVILPT